MAVPGQGEKMSWSFAVLEWRPLLGVLLLSCFLHATGSEARPKAMGKPRSTKDLLSREWELSWPPKITDIRSKLAIHDRFVPVIGASKQRRYVGSFLEKRQELFNSGCYPGVEYRIKAIEVKRCYPGAENATEVDTIAEALQLSEVEGPPAAIYLTVRPAYKLIPQLERAWPVRVELSSIPWCLSRGAYNIVTVASSALLASSFLMISFFVSQTITLSVVNSRSMIPSILPKDVILVEKIAPSIKRAVGLPVAGAGDVLFFREPKGMAEYIKRNNLPPIGNSDLVVKRVKEISSSCIEMRGDNPRYSVDSRDWGCLPAEDVVGTPVLRIWPPQRVGPLK